MVVLILLLWLSLSLYTLSKRSDRVIMYVPKTKFIHNTGSSYTLHPHLPNNSYYVSCCKSLIIINTLQVCPKNDSLLLDKMTPYHITRAHAPHRHCAVCSYRDNNTIISASMSRAYILMIVISARPVNCVCMSRKHIACMHYTYY